MKLNYSIFKERERLIMQGYQLPAYDAREVAAKTMAAPRWVHFGAGNILRSFLAQLVQEHLNAGRMQQGIVAVEGFDMELVDQIYAPHDSLSLNAVLLADGKIEKTLVASICGAVKADRADAAAWQWLLDAFALPTLQMASFTITEKGYSIANQSGELLPQVKVDIDNGPDRAQSYIGKVAALLHNRFTRGAFPIAMVSMDNCSHNGEKLYNAVSALAKGWRENGLVDQGFVDYVADPTVVSFPFSMIDKITPRPDETVQALFEKDGFEGIAPIVTQKHTCAAAFVNAEKPQYLVIEDLFPAGSPLPAGGGVFFTDRDHVTRCETMKVTTCLNPLHTALAVMGCLLSHVRISDEMQDADLKAMVERLGYQEGLPVVVDPEILSPLDFLKEVLTQRLPNPYMPDTPQRIACDTSQKMAIRFGETVKAYQRAGKDMAQLQVIPLVQAAWLRYLLAVDDAGNAFEVSPDPLASSLQQKLSAINWDQPADHQSILEPIFSDASLFGVNLYEVGLGKAAEGYFEDMLGGVGAVRRTLQRVCAM